MILEVCVTFATLASGALLLRSVGLRGWGLLPLGLVVGTSLITVVGTLLVVLNLPTSSLLTYGIAVGLPAVWWAGSLAVGRDVGLPTTASVATFVSLVPIVWIFREANLARVNPDSFHLIVSGSLMHSGRLEALPPARLEAWQVAMGSIHGVANLQGEAYLKAATPLLAIAAVGVLVWMIERALSTMTQGPAWGLAGLGGAVLLTNHRFLYNAFYLNRHVFVGAALLIVAAAAWGLCRRGIAPQPVLLALLAAMLPGLALARAETPVVAGLVLVPLLSSNRIARRHRLALVALLGATVVQWNLWLVFQHRGVGDPASATSLTLTAFGAAMLLTAGVMSTRWSWVDPFPRWMPTTVEVALWVGAVAIAISSPRLVLDSAVATFRNLALDVGGWGSSLIVLALIVAAVLAVTSEGDRILLRFPMTTFVPYAIWLAYLRAPGGMPYRDARSDSLSRMLLHFVPLAIFYVATSSSAADWSRVVRSSFRRRRRSSAASSPPSGPSVPSAHEGTRE
jgi:hypothetical protein